MSHGDSPRRFRPGMPVLLANPKRPALEVTVRAHHREADVDVIEGEARPYIVTVDDGPCAGLKLWAAERELGDRPVTDARGRH